MTPDDLIEIELIRQLKYKYARCLDLKLWDDLATTLTEDVVVDYSGGKYHHEGREAVVACRHRAVPAEIAVGAAGEGIVLEEVVAEMALPAVHALAAKRPVERLADVGRHLLHDRIARARPRRIITATCARR